MNIGHMGQRNRRHEYKMSVEYRARLQDKMTRGLEETRRTHVKNQDWDEMRTKGPEE
jgi:hypothetical protein